LKKYSNNLPMLNRKITLNVLSLHIQQKKINKNFENCWRPLYQILQSYWQKSWEDVLQFFIWTSGLFIVRTTGGQTFYGEPHCQFCWYQGPHILFLSTPITMYISKYELMINSTLFCFTFIWHYTATHTETSTTSDKITLTDLKYVLFMCGCHAGCILPIPGLHKHTLNEIIKWFSVRNIIYM